MATINPLAPTALESPAQPISHEDVLDRRDPLKWQLKIRLHLETLNTAESEEWLQSLRLVATMAASIVRDHVNRQTTTRCYICKGVFKDGKPQAEAGYYDAERTYVKIYACDQSEFNDLMRACKQKEDAIALAEKKANAAALTAARDARRAAGAREIRE